MISPNKWRRNLQKYYSFLTSCLWSFLGLVFYLFAKNFARFPDKWLTGSSQSSVNLFSFGISIHSGVNFFLQMLFSFLTLEKRADYPKIRKWKYWAKKILIFASCITYTTFQNWDHLKSGSHIKWEDVFFLGLITTVINCCLIDLLLQLMDQYGVCNAFNLIFFADCLSVGWIIKENRNHLKILGLFLITVLFIWITNLKWEVPVETNTLYSQDDSLAKKTTSHLGFKLNFSFIPFYYSSWFLSWIYGFKIVWEEINQSSQSRKVKEIIRRGMEKLRSLERKRVVSITDKEVDNKSWGDILFIINEEKNFLNWKQWKEILTCRKKWKIFGVTTFFFFLRWLFSWFQVSQMQWKSSEVSEDLQQRGVYLDGIPPGRSTQKLVKKIVNKLIIFWFFLVVFPLNLVFDNLISGEGFPTFTSWFSSVNIGISLIHQIRTKYKYVQANQ